MISIGTDCSGIDAPIHALRQIGIPFKHVWSCEIDKYARLSINANSVPEILYTDITKRNHSLLPDVDIYVCGFPCQPFSLMGLKNGSMDSRSNIMFECIKVISKKLPNIFILENVKNFYYIENGKPMTYLINTLNELGKYTIYYEILNTKDYGIPQNRERVYIIGIKNEIQKEEYTTPEKKIMRNLEEFILDKTIYERYIYNSLQKNINKINNEKNYIITPFNHFSALKNISPTLTTQCNKYFHTTYKRFLTTKECLLLQGFDNNFNQVVSNTQLYKQIGNSMSVNVLVEIIKKIIKITIYDDI